MTARARYFAARDELETLLATMRPAPRGGYSPDHNERMQREETRDDALETYLHDQPEDFFWLVGETYDDVSHVGIYPFRLYSTLDAAGDDYPTLTAVPAWEWRFIRNLYPGMTVAVAFPMEGDR